MLKQNVGLYKFNKFLGVQCLKLRTPIHNQMFLINVVHMS